MSDEFHIAEFVKRLKVNAAKRYNISEKQCHIGHVALEAMLERPDMINQIDAATDTNETNLSVAKRSMRLANSMSKFGLKPGDCVVIMGPNHLDLAIPYFACHLNGYPMCAVDPNGDAAEIKALFKYISPKIVFCPKVKGNGIKEALKANNLDGQIVFFDDPDKDLLAFNKEQNGTHINFRPAVFDQSKISAWYMLTSGTTGLPKVAIIPFDTLLNGIIAWWKPFTAKFEITMAMATIQWLSSLVFFISGPLRNYTRVQSSIALTPQRLVALINKYKPNVTAWTPHLLNQFLQAAEKFCDLSSFKYIAIGGSAIEKPLLERLKKQCGAYLYLVYGMTELLVPVFDFVDETPIGSTGKPFSRFQYRIVDGDGNVLNKPFETGELWLKGDEFFKGYLNNPEETNAVLTDDGWIKTGDMFYKDEEDFYFFVERKRLLIKYTGHWVSPLQLEEVIRRHPAVAEVCVVGLPSTDLMEIPVAAILKRDGQNLEPEDIFELIKGAVPEIRRLHGGYFLVDALPFTPSGKIHRAKVREMALQTPMILPK